MGSVAVLASKRRRLPGDVRRRQLQRCALSVFARDGIGRAGHTQVAELARVSVATVFKYFPTREALLEAVLDRVESTLLSLARRSHRNAASAREAIRAHSHGWCQLMEEEPEIVKVWMEWSASIRGDIWPRFLALEEKLNRIISRTIGRDPQPPKNLGPLEIARAIHGMAYMTAHMHFAPDRGAEDPETIALNVVDALLGFERS